IPNFVMDMRPARFSISWVGIISNVVTFLDFLPAFRGRVWIHMSIDIGITTPIFPVYFDPPTKSLAVIGRILPTRTYDFAICDTVNQTPNIYPAQWVISDVRI